MNEYEQVQKIVRKTLVDLSQDEELIEAIATFSFKLFDQLMLKGFSRTEALTIVASYNSKK